MTRAACLRSSKRKPAKSSQEVFPDDFKENSPSILSQNSRKALLANKTSKSVKENKALSRKSSNCLKENISPEECLKYIVSTPKAIEKDVHSPIRKSVRRLKPVEQIKTNQERKNVLSDSTNSFRTNKNHHAEQQVDVLKTVENKNTTDHKLVAVPKLNCINDKGNFENHSPVHSPIRKSVRRLKTADQVKTNQEKRNVLSDSTNSFRTNKNHHDEQKVDVLKTVENKNSIVHKLVAVPKLNCINDEGNLENHVPIYKTVPDKSLKNTSSPNEKIENVYEFEVDENEDPAPKKKRKKRIYTRKPKIGPKALTINNIKYSSTESLASLPDKHVVRKKKTTKGTKGYSKSHSSAVPLNDSGATSVSAASFMSHPPSTILYQNSMPKSRHELSVLQETMSEQCYSPVPCMEINGPSVSKVIETASSSSVVPSTVSYSKVVHLSDSRNTQFSPNPRCYGSKSGRTPNPYCEQLVTSYPNNTSNTFSSSSNMLTYSPNFLSSTPCKRVSLVVRNNSVFDESCDIPLGIRPSTGLIKNTSASVVSNDNCFGFDEPEELEEPLVSPIKNRIDLEPRRERPKKIPYELDMQKDEVYKPSVQEVIDMLKATLPPKVSSKKESTEVFNSSSGSSGPSSPAVVEKDASVFIKPARRSYERQRRVRYNSDTEEESEEEKENIEEAAPKQPPKEIKKCYKKVVNTTKTSKPPKVTKANQRIAKQEEELERLAAQMNAQFQEIDKVSLVVE